MSIRDRLTAIADRTPTHVCRGRGPRSSKSERRGMKPGATAPPPSASCARIMVKFSILRNYAGRAVPGIDQPDQYHTGCDIVPRRAGHRFDASRIPRQGTPAPRPKPVRSLPLASAGFAGRMTERIESDNHCVRHGTGARRCRPRSSPFLEIYFSERLTIPIAKCYLLSL